MEPSGELQDQGKQLRRDTKKVLANLREQFSNLQIAYVGSRIYGGYTDGSLNSEPFVYEGAFVVRWLIQSQVQGDNIKRPLLLWGPYL
ncbi:hypothetical protein [Rubripirellula reticaptiva]|uniref:Uncharacterized protein n=1 Tax=Rubripirellula reticaptiva TaxID=2528013 RepID=A0A5C6F3I6_9BACT|nr:hypothetical protein [Rubripirellula reticaptiva]TWU56363.1 hypothetical protein Poly59_26670 [Rubripirellula reticaptiva]